MRIGVVPLIAMAFGLRAMAQPPAVRAGRAVLADFSAAIEQLARSAAPAVVQIAVQGRAPVEDGEERHAGFVAEQRATGSGVIVDPEGYIVTNAHVVRDARHIDVSLIDRPASERNPSHRHFPAKVVGMDRETDLAVLKIEGKRFPVLAFRDTPVKQGQLVVALGSPLGLDNSLTVGFVSTPARHLSPMQPLAYIQTDTPINPGNSGGPLLDDGGGIVGINTMIMTQSGGNEGIGFAIPASVVRRVYGLLRKDGRIHRGAIGVVPDDITPTLAAALGLGLESGVILSDIVPHGAAEAAGLAPGDIILEADGAPVPATRNLLAAIFHHSAGEEMTLLIQRGDRKIQKTVAVMAKPRSRAELSELASRDAHLVKRLGILALTVDENVTPILPDLRRLSGVVVAAIPAEFVALNPGLASGDVIYELNGVGVASVDQLRGSLDRYKAGAPIALLIERSGQLQYVAFELE
jgi:serine protease Do